jgi:anaerobic dimethyl sulfoxide reductase subunit A
VWITEGLVDEAFVAAHATGWGLLRSRVLGEEGAPGEAGSAPGGSSALPPGQAATPEWAESVCGTPAARIVALAREWARRRPTTLIPGLSIQRTWGGEEAVRLAIALQVATGNLGLPGGSSGGRTWGGLPGPRFEGIPVPPNPVDGDIPANDWADVVLRGRIGGHPVDIKAFYSVGGNYVAQAGDVHKSVRAMEALEFSVCHELFLTATARYCDVVLPVTHWLERDDVVFTSANYLLFSHKVAHAPGQARDDYDVFSELAELMRIGDDFTAGKDADAWLAQFIERSEVPDADEFRAAGIYFAPSQERVGLAAFAEDPGRYPLATPSGKVELAGEACVAAGLSEVPEARVLTAGEVGAQAEGPGSGTLGGSAYPLRLVTPKSRYRVHSQLDDIPWFHERDDRSLWMSPADAGARGIADGDAVVVASAQGSSRCVGRVTEDITPGVASLCEGIEPAFGADGVDEAGAANVLTSDAPTLPSRGATMHSTFVEVRLSEVAPAGQPG